MKYKYQLYDWSLPSACKKCDVKFLYWHDLKELNSIKLASEYNQLVSKVIKENVNLLWINNFQGDCLMTWQSSYLIAIRSVLVRKIFYHIGNESQHFDTVGLVIYVLILNCKRFHRNNKAQNKEHSLLCFATFNGWLKCCLW